MNASKLFDSKSAAALSEGGDLIGVALIVPTPSAINWVSVFLFCRALEGRLGAKGLEPGETGVSFGSGFIVWTMEARSRNPALRAVELVLKEMGLWNLCQVAFFDKAEAYWRTIHPSGAPTFERFLSKENREAAKQQVARELEFALFVQATCKSIIEGKQRGAE